MKDDRKWLRAAVAAGVLWMAGCGSQPIETAQANTSGAVASEIEVPAGTELQVRLNEALGSRRTGAGERFDATLHAPVVVSDRVVLPKGAIVHGRVTRAVASGHLKTPARLSVTLDTVEWRGKSYAIATSSVNRSARSHKNRNLALIGGGSGAGALIGGLAGGGTGALIGAGAGAGAGAAGAYTTGRKDVLLPAESLLVFRLQAPVLIKK